LKETASTEQTSAAQLLAYQSHRSAERYRFDRSKRKEEETTPDFLQKLNRIGEDGSLLQKAAEGRWVTEGHEANEETRADFLQKVTKLTKGKGEEDRVLQKPNRIGKDGSLLQKAAEGRWATEGHEANEKETTPDFLQKLTKLFSDL
jgi:hypothetical protein